jgi:hypothetical protein
VLARNDAHNSGSTAGFFSANAGGLAAAMASLLGHLAYGAVLGAITREVRTGTRVLSPHRA